MRRLCYAAAMSRRWGVGVEWFLNFESGPKTIELKGRKFVYKRAADNGDVPTLIELCLHTIDGAYAHMGNSVGPEAWWARDGISMPTAIDHNNKLCVVKRRRLAAGA